MNLTSREIPARCRTCTKPIVRIDDAESETWFCCPVAVTRAGAAAPGCDNPCGTPDPPDILSIEMSEWGPELEDDYSDPPLAGTWEISARAAMAAAFLVGVLQDRNAPTELRSSVGEIEIVGDKNSCGRVSARFVMATAGSAFKSRHFYRQIDNAIDWERWGRRFAERARFRDGPGRT